MRAALYTRVSTTEQALEGYSLPAQDKMLRSYCTAKGYTVVRVYCDEGVSAKDVAHRPGMQQLTEDLKKDIYDVVIVWKLTRLTRSLRDLITICDSMEAHGVHLVSCTEAFDGATSTGRLLRNILGVVAQWEREVISDNVKLGMAERAAQGKRTCSYVLGYDSDGDCFTVNRDEAAIIRWIYQSYLACKSTPAVAAMCNDLGYHGKMGGKMSTSSVHKILTRPIYCGYNQYRDRIYPASHEAIIDADTYNRVQQMLKSSNAGRPRKRNDFEIPAQ